MFVHCVVIIWNQSTANASLPTSERSVARIGLEKKNCLRRLIKHRIHINSNSFCKQCSCVSTFFFIIYLFFGEKKKKTSLAFLFFFSEIGGLAFGVGTSQCCILNKYCWHSQSHLWEVPQIAAQTGWASPEWRRVLLSGRLRGPIWILWWVPLGYDSGDQLRMCLDSGIGETNNTKKKFYLCEKILFFSFFLNLCPLQVSKKTNTRDWVWKHFLWDRQPNERHVGVRYFIQVLPDIVSVTGKRNYGLFLSTQLPVRIYRIFPEQSKKHKEASEA